MAPAEARLAAGLCLLAAASCGTPRAAPPPGWQRSEIPGCCAIHLPPGSRMAALADPIDNPGYRIEGKGFEGVAYVQAGPAAPPIATSGPRFSTRRLEIDGRRAWLTSLAAEGSAGRGLIVDWSTGRPAGKPGESVHGEFSCAADACAALETAVLTLTAS